MNISFFKHAPSVQVTIKIIESYMRAFEGLGHRVMSIDHDLALHTTDDINKFAETFIRFKPDFAICYGFAAMPPIDGGYFFRKQGIPLIVLCFENPFLGLSKELINEIKQHQDYYHLFVWDPYYLDLIHKTFPNCHPILHAADIIGIEKNRTKNDLFRDISFVGNITDSAALREKRLHINPANINELLDRILVKKMNSPAQNLIDIIHEEIKADPNLMDDAPLFDETGEQFHKQIIFPVYEEALGFYRFNVLKLLDEFSIDYYGNMEWDASHINFHPSVSYDVELPGIYQTSLINLDIPPLQSIHSLNNRIFDVGANNSFVLTEKRGDFSKLTVHAEDYTYSSLDDLKEKIRFYLNNRDKRDEAAQRLHECIIGEHTYEHRVRYIIDSLAGKI